MAQYIDIKRRLSQGFQRVVEGRQAGIAGQSDFDTAGSGISGQGEFDTANGGISGQGTFKTFDAWVEAGLADVTFKTGGGFEDMPPSDVEQMARDWAARYEPDSLTRLADIKKLEHDFSHYYGRDAYLMEEPAYPAMGPAISIVVTDMAIDIHQRLLEDDFLDDDIKNDYVQAFESARNIFRRMGRAMSQNKPEHYDLAQKIMDENIGRLSANGHPDLLSLVPALPYREDKLTERLAIMLGLDKDQAIFEYAREIVQHYRDGLKNTPAMLRAIGSARDHDLITQDEFEEYAEKIVNFGIHTPKMVSTGYGKRIDHYDYDHTSTRFGFFKDSQSREPLKDVIAEAYEKTLKANPSGNTERMIAEYHRHVDELAVMREKQIAALEVRKGMKAASEELLAHSDPAVRPRS
ncbi:MAG: hypothetical protein KDI46_10015 [Alphaproteobacteria bacterium]|nr:hypothetical protein [Alphaproteobacteria bacterium]